jgi:hypothetical protein
MNFETLSIVDARACLADIARDAESTFGALNVAQLNWRRDGGCWSVAQCFDHLLSANRQMFAAADVALAGVSARTVWQRLPVLPAVFGKALIRSQSPTGTKKYKAPSVAQPSASDIAGDVIQRFIQQQHDAITRLETLDEDAAAGIIMTSPFIRFITYSVLDGWRIVVAHDRRHVEQARRVTESGGFPLGER